LSSVRAILQIIRTVIRKIVKSPWQSISSRRNARAKCTSWKVNRK